MHEQESCSSKAIFVIRTNVTVKVFPIHDLTKKKGVLGTSSSPKKTRGSCMGIYILPHKQLGLLVT